MAAVIVAVNNSKGQLYVEVQVQINKGGIQDYLALFDTGACVSIVDSTLAAELSAGQIYQDQDRSVIRNASGDIMSTVGKVKLTIGMGRNNYTQEFIVTSEENIPCNIILGWDFIKKQRITFSTDPLSLNIDGKPVKVVELPVNHLLEINKEEKTLTKVKEEEKIRDRDMYKCQVPEATLLNGESIGYIILETKMSDEGEIAIFEPVEGNIGAHMLCPGLVKLEKDKDRKKARFIIKYINHRNEDVQVEPGKTLGYVQLGTQKQMDKERGTIVTAITEKTEEERLKELYSTVDHMFTQGSKENAVLKQLIGKFQTVFANNEDAPNITPFFFHTIQLDSAPKPKKPYIMPVCYEEKVQQQIYDMLQQGIIRPSRSPIHSPLVPVVKKDGKIRLCVDYRNLNQHIINDSYPLPNINSILHNLGKGNTYSCLDLKQGYHQIPLHENSKHLTAFIAPGGLYEYNVMPMGLKDSPSAFSRIINQVLIGLTGSNVYMDDIIVQGDGLEDNIKNLEEVLVRLQEAKLTVKLSKCDFFKPSVKYLGHIVSAEGLKPQPEKIETISNMPRPQTVRQLQSFLGLINYYRRYIKNYAHIASPLHKLTGGRVNETKLKKEIQWNAEAEVAFEKLKETLAEKVTLAFPNFKKKFFLTTDASNVAIGGVLQQKDENNQLRPLTFFSRKLSQSEAKYSTIEREALAIVYGLKINRPLCLGFPIVVHTDHRPLTWLLSTSNVNGRIARWQLLVAEFDIEVNFIPGKDNKVADCLSRLKLQDDSVIEDILTITNDESNENIVNWNLEELIRLQNENTCYSKIKELLKQDCDVQDIKRELSKHKIERKYKRLRLEELRVENDILYRVATNDYGEQIRQVIIPDSYKHQVLRLAHSLPTAGHGGVQMTLARCKKFAYWPEMIKDVQQYCTSCLTCRRFKRLGDAPAPLQRYPDIEMPFERVHIDLIGPMGHSERNYKYCMVVIDVLTRFLIAEPLKTKEATEVARIFVDRVICNHGVPKVLVSDQGKEFTNKILKGIAELLRMKHVTTTPYHPQANGVIERCNGTVINILRTLIEDNVSIWDTMLPIAVFAYNSGYNRTIKDSPFYLMYLRDPLAPFEVLKEQRKWYNVDDFKHEMATKAHRVYQRCQQYLEVAREQFERKHSKRARIKPVQVGDRVYVKQVPAKGSPSKLQPAYGGPFRVTEKISDVVVKLRNIRTGTSKTLHTDRIRVVHEDNMTQRQNRNVRRAYPVHDDDDETNETQVPTQPLDPFPFYRDDSVDDDATSAIQNQQPDFSQSNDILEPKSPPVQQRYSLRSSAKAPELPLVMQKPIEYLKTT